MNNDCPFCHDPSPIIVGRNAFVRYDRFPVSPGHVLVIPNRHVASFFDLTKAEKKEIFNLVNKARHLIQEEFRPDGYNIGINIGESAGQTVWHVHVHLIPRYTGDVQNPRGGVRGVIPTKQSY